MLNSLKLTKDNYHLNLLRFSSNPLNITMSGISTIFGIAITAYLGYRIVSWIINKCHETKKVDEVVKENFSDNQDINSSKPLIDLTCKLTIDSDKIKMGHGEYVIFHAMPNGEKKELTRETYEKIYQLLNYYSPSAIVARDSESVTKECANRYELIHDAVKKTDKTLEVVFVPRTLYELIFVRKCIKEDLKHNEICPLLGRLARNPALHLFKDSQEYDKFLKFKKEEQVKRKCWHICYFDDVGDSEDPGVKDVAYRLNQTIIKSLCPTADGFTYKEIAQHAEKEFEFLKNYHETNTEAMKKKIQGKFLYSSSDPGPATNFGCERKFSMGIRDNIDAQVLRNTIALECSEIATKVFLLYRGGDFQKDSTLYWEDSNKINSVSLATSPFAGCVHDGGATSFHYMRNKKNAYAIPIPFEELKNSLFHYPNTHAVAQFFGDGETFHARTKAPKDYNPNELKGIDAGANSHKRDHLKSGLSKDELINQFQHYKDKAIQLK